MKTSLTLLFIILSNPSLANTLTPRIYTQEVVIDVIENGDWIEGRDQNHLAIVPMSVNTIFFSSYLVTTNGHSCSVEGFARKTMNNTFRNSDQCEIEIEFSEKLASIVAIGGNCSNFCGSRAKGLMSDVHQLETVSALNKLFPVITCEERLNTQEKGNCAEESYRLIEQSLLERLEEIDSKLNSEKHFLFALEQSKWMQSAHDKCGNPSQQVDPEGRNLSLICMAREINNRLFSILAYESRE